MTVTPAGPLEPVLVPFDRISALAFGSTPGVTLIEVRRRDRDRRAGAAPVVGQGGEAAAARLYVKVGRFAKATIVLEQTGRPRWPTTSR